MVSITTLSQKEYKELKNQTAHHNKRFLDSLKKEMKRSTYFN